MRHSSVKLSTGRMNINSSVFVNLPPFSTSQTSLYFSLPVTVTKSASTFHWECRFSVPLFSEGSLYSACDWLTFLPSFWPIRVLMSKPNQLKPTKTMSTGQSETGMMSFLLSSDVETLSENSRQSKCNLRQNRIKLRTRQSGSGPQSTYYWPVC